MRVRKQRHENKSLCIYRHQPLWFIAREDGNLDWLDEAATTTPEGEDCGYAVFTESVDPLTMGRKTYEKGIRLTHSKTTAFDFGFEFVQSTYVIS